MRPVHIRLVDIHAATESMRVMHVTFGRERNPIKRPLPTKHSRRHAIGNPKRILHGEIVQAIRQTSRIDRRSSARDMDAKQGFGDTILLWGVPHGDKTMESMLTAEAA